MYVIIPAYQNSEKLNRCLQHVKNQSTAATGIYIHNNSSDNIGFTRAVNEGLKIALSERHEFALLLNQDAYLPRDAISTLISFMKVRPRCAIAGVKQLLTCDDNIITHGGCEQAFPFGVHLVGLRSAGDCNMSSTMPWVNAAVMAVRLEAVIEIGLMDTNMFLVGGDSDWCYSARLRNWQVWYCAEVEALHDGGAASKEEPSDYLKEIFARDMEYWRRKWVGSEHYRWLRHNRPCPEAFTGSKLPWRGSHQPINNLISISA